MTPTNPRELLDHAPMSRTQKSVIAMTAILSALDGYDILSISFAAPAISQEWGVGKAALGVVLSSGLAGMMAGSFFLAPWGDRVGRRAIVLLALTIMGLGMLASALADSVPVLAALRFFTGIGLGAMVAVIAPLTAEFANARYRTLAMALMTIGFPLGGMIGGFVAAHLLAISGWESIFIAGAMASLLMLPIIYFALPESISYLLKRDDARSREKAEALLSRMGHDVDGLVIEQPVAERRKTRYRDIFAPGHRATTLAITGANFCYMIAVYFFLSWVPQIVTDHGFDASTGSVVAAIANVSGVVGSIAFGVAALFLSLRWLAIGVAVAMGVALVIFGFIPSDLTLLFIAAIAVGGCLNAGITATFTVTSTAFPSEMRTTGVGFALGFGRVAGTIAPLFAGLLFQAGFALPGVATLMGAFAVLAGVLLYRATRPQAASNQAA